LCVASDDAATAHVIVWDWTTGKMLLDLEDRPYQSVTFVDDFWLVLSFRGEQAPLSGGHLAASGLMFLNTEQTKKGEEHAQTTFNLWSSKFLIGVNPSHFSGHEPSREDVLFAPFYPDPLQRVLVFEVVRCNSLFVMKVEALLRLARDRKGEVLQWGEWRAHATRVGRDGYGIVSDPGFHFVCGPRLCCVYPNEFGRASMDVYDFGARASAGYAEMAEDAMDQRVKPSAARVLPWGIEEIIFSYGCHDSITFVLGSQDRLGYIVHTWNFV